jgi:hypothetical protein
MKKMLTAVIAGILGGFCPVISPAAAADPFHASYQALKNIAMQVQTDTALDTFSKQFEAAKEAVTKLTADGGQAPCESNLKRALDAYEIVYEIWQAQRYDSKISSDYACISVDKYQYWLKLFPALLTWKWGQTGVGVSPAEQALFKPFNCYIILQPWLNDVWAPCLFNEAQKEIQSAEKCLAVGNK